MVETTLSTSLFAAGAFGRREAFGEAFDPTRGPRRRGDATEGTGASSRNSGQTIQAQAIPADVPRGSPVQFPRLSSTFVAQFIAQEISPAATSEPRTRFETAVGAYRQAQSFLDARRGGPAVLPTVPVETLDTPFGDDPEDDASLG